MDNTPVYRPTFCFLPHVDSCPLLPPAGQIISAFNRQSEMPLYTTIPSALVPRFHKRHQRKKAGTKKVTWADELASKKLAPSEMCDLRNRVTDQALEIAFLRARLALS